MSDTYRAFIERKSQLRDQHGFAPLWMPEFLFDFQRKLVDWAIKKGRAAIFADCGLGKTPMQLVWAQNVVQKTNKTVLILTPLAVSYQTASEAMKFHIEALRSEEGELPAKIVITNYERLDYFDSSQFAGVVCDESSILKNFDGITKKKITTFLRKIPYRLLCTATAAPNDYIELGTSAEALGELGYMDMLQRFFKNDQNSIKPTWARRFEKRNEMFGNNQKWRFRGHAELPFWRWVSSWSRALRKPSDLGCDDSKFVLPPLTEKEYLVTAERLAEGMLLSLPAIGLKEQRDERRRSVQARCEKIAELVNGKRPALVWCHLNDEGDLLQKLIPDGKQVKGSDSNLLKEQRLLNFARGNLRVLITKPKIGAWGLNFQHCSHVTFFPSHSFEQYYQGVRRCWRFGQTCPVQVDIVTTEGEREVAKNLRRKSNAADKMFSSLVAEMNHAQGIASSNGFKEKEVVPKWLS